MTLSIKDPEAGRLARALARRTGETITQAVIRALRERLAREERKPDDDQLVEDVLEIGRHYASLVRDRRFDEEIIDYDEHGLPIR